MNKKATDIARSIHEVTKDYKISQVTNCLTRLRLHFVGDAPTVEKLKTCVGVINVVVVGDEFQIIIGPGLVDEVYHEFVKIATVSTNEETQRLVQTTTTFGSGAKKNIISSTLAKFAKIFSPLIPAFVGAGILAGFACILKIFMDPNISSQLNINAKTQTILGQWYAFFQTALTVWGAGFMIIVGWNFCDIFGGKKYIGGVIGCMFCSLAAPAFNALFHPDQTLIGNDGFCGNAYFLGIPIHNIKTNWMTSGLCNPKYGDDGNITTYTIGAPLGQLFGVILACILAIWVDKGLRRIIPTSLSLFFVPILTVLAVLLAAIFLIIPVSGYIILGLAWFFENVTTGNWAILGDTILATVFLFLLMFGLHSSLIPVYATLLNNPPHLNTIFPLLGMGSFSMIGGMLALCSVAPKGGELRKNIKSTFLTSFLGIDEPALYGVILPRIVPLFTCALGTGIAGFAIGLVQILPGHFTMGVEMLFGVNGIWGVFTVISLQNWWVGKIIYFAGAAIAIVAGFLLTIIGYRIFKNNKKINWNLN